MHWKRRGWTLIGALLLAVPGAMRMGTLPVSAQVSQIETTYVTDTVHLADGTPATGSVLISWQAFTTATGLSVPAGTTTATIGAGGALSVQLTPNAGATPLGSFYTAVYHLNDGTMSREFWVVPVSQTPVQVSTIKSTVLPTAVAMQTVSKSYVDTAIAAAVSGQPVDAASPFVIKNGGTMTGPLVLAGDPVSSNQAADKQYVDASVTNAQTTNKQYVDANVTNIQTANKQYVDSNIASVQTGLTNVLTGLSQKLAMAPAGTQTIAQPTGTQLRVNNLNGEKYASQYATPSSPKGIANALASSDCATGCDVKVDHSYNSTEGYAVSTWNSNGAGGTHVEDDRSGQRTDNYLNPTPPTGKGANSGQTIQVVSTRKMDSTFSSQPGSTGLLINHQAFTGGNNLYPGSVEAVPYFKTNYWALGLYGTYNTPGQHILAPGTIHCYGVGDCLIGSQVITSAGGFRDYADEGTHPYDIQVMEDATVFQGVCSQGCTPGSTLVTVGSITGQGTQGEGRFLINKNPTKVISTGLLTGGSVSSTLPGSVANFSGTNFPLSVFLATGQAVLSQPKDIAPGTVTIPIATSGVPSGFATSTSALPGQSGVACITEANNSFVHDYEMVPYTVVDDTHLQMTFQKVHTAAATIAVGGLCGYGLEETVDTARGIRQVFPVIGSFSPTALYYAGGESSIIGIAQSTGGFLNINMAIRSIVRSNNVVTVTTKTNIPVDVNSLTITISGVPDSSFNGSFPVTTTASNVLTYSQTGPDGTSTDGTASMVTGGYALYPMAEVLGVFNATTKSVDGQLTLAPNTVAWAVNDPVEEPHYYQEKISADMTHVTQTTPRPLVVDSMGIQFEQTAGPGLMGWFINNNVPASYYLGNGGTHAAPTSGMAVGGIWQKTMDLHAGDISVFSIHCNSHGCGKWNSKYDLMQLDTPTGFDEITFQPPSSTYTMTLHGTQFAFSPQGFNAGSITAQTLNAGAITATSINASAVSGMLNAAQVPVFGGSGSGHAAGVVPDPGATAGTTRFLREDGSWAGIPVAGQSATNLLARYALTEGSGAPTDSSGNGNNATLPGGSLNPSWTTQGLSCNGSSQYFNSTGTRGARTIVWASTEMVPQSGASPVGPQYVTPFGASDLSLEFQGANYYGSHPGTSIHGVVASQSNDTMQGTHVFVWTLGTNASTDPDHLYIDGAETTYASGTTRSASAGKATSDLQVCGVPSGAAHYFPGSLYYFEAFSDEKTPAQAQQETATVKQIVQSRGVQFQPAQDATTTNLYLAVGDSLTNGAGVSPSSQFVAPSDTFTVTNYGLGAAQLDDLTQLFDARELPTYRRNAGRNVIRLWAGTNDVAAGHSAQQTMMAIRAYCNKAKRAGFQTIVSDMVSRTGQDSAMMALDNLMTSEDTGCDLVLDLASNPVLGAAGASANTTYYQADGLNLTLTAQQNVVAPAETRAINLLDHLKSSNMSPTVTTATYTMQDYDLYLPVNPAANSVAATLPDCGYFTGMTRSIKNLQGSGSNTVTVAPAAGQTIDGSSAPVTVANGATLVLRQMVPNRATAGCTWVKVSNN